MDHSSRDSESPLSDISSDEFAEDKFQRNHHLSNSHSQSDSESDLSGFISTPRNSDHHPSKRRRIGDYDASTPRILHSPAGSISSDSSNSVPNSPSFANLGPTHPLSTAYAAFQANPNDPESADYTQVTRCGWASCANPEQNNMDNLVVHINEAHIPPKQKKYFCEWEGCTRSAMPHTSAYALKAHMRSHTKEKPFMCSVPECDRSFTRSDALAKHMRTVHETEALRPSDPVPRGHLGGIAQTEQNGSSKRLKLTFKKTETANGEIRVEGAMPALPTMGMAAEMGVPATLAALDADEADIAALSRAVDIDAVPLKVPVDESYYPEDVYQQMEDYERNLPPSQWFRVLRRQLKWAEEDRVKLEKELNEVKAKTDDLMGNAVTKEGSNVGDAIRLDEWAITENLLDRIADAEIRGAGMGLVNGHTDAMDVDHDQTKTPFERVVELPYFKNDAV